MKSIRRWAPWFALVVLFSIATSLLSWWQFTRREERVERIAQVQANYDQDVVPYSSLNFDENLAQLEWRPVSVTGNYLPDQAVVVRNRPLAGRAGFLQLIPFQLEDGRVIAVERGWIAAGNPITTPAANPLPDGQSRELVLRIRAAEPSLGRGLVEGQLASITPAEIIGLESSIIKTHYGRLVAENPASNQLPLAMPKPSLDEGNHLSYALQWVLFGLMAFGAFIWAIRNERRIQLEEQGLVPRRVKRKNQAALDAEIEDAR